MYNGRESNTPAVDRRVGHFSAVDGDTVAALLARAHSLLGAGRPVDGDDFLLCFVDTRQHHVLRGEAESP